MWVLAAILSIHTNEQNLVSEIQKKFVQELASEPVMNYSHNAIRAGNVMTAIWHSFPVTSVEAMKTPNERGLRALEPPQTCLAETRL